MPMLTIPTQLFKQMQSYKSLERTERQRQTMKYDVLRRITDKVQKRWKRAVKLTRVLDEVIFKATDRGYSFNGRETLAKLCDCGLSTIDEAIKVLKESGEAVVVYRENPKSNGFKTPVVILKNHPHYAYWEELLQLDKIVDQEVEQEVENAENPWESKPRSVEKVSTYYLPSKQERNNNINDNVIIEYVVNRVRDAVKKGAKVKYLSSYINRVVGSLEDQALHNENMRQKALRQRREREAREQIGQALKLRKTPTESIPFFNWLES